LNDKELIKSAQKGEKKAFQDLITIYYPYVLGFLLNLTQNNEISEDITQDTFLKIIQKIDYYDINGKASFSTYIITIAKNLYIDYLRRNQHISICLDEQSEQSSQFCIEQAVENKMELQEFMKDLEQIPTEQALAIKLKYFEGLTLNEIAEKTSCEPKTVKSRIHNGFVKLRRMNN